MIFELTQFTDISLLLLRVIVAIVFFSSGWSHISKPKERGESMGMSPFITWGLGLWEVIGALSVLLGIFTQIGALMLIIVMLGAIYKKIFVWKMKFFQNQTGGWHYDIIFLTANLVILTTGGGNFILL